LEEKNALQQRRKNDVTGRLEREWKKRLEVRKEKQSKLEDIQELDKK